MNTPNESTSSALTGVVLAITLGAASASGIAAVVEIEDFDVWSAAVGEFTTIGFTELPHGTWVFEQYADLGVHFMDGEDIVLCCDREVFPQDGAGVKSSPPEIHLIFDVPQFVFGCHYPAVVQFETFYRGKLQTVSSIFQGGLDQDNFASIMSTTPFDEIVVTNAGVPTCFPGDFCFVFLDSLYFSSSGPDCDVNGVFDYIDVLEGTLPDCNGNLIPDGCDIDSATSGDCNTNRIPDECDIAAETSSDCNDNLIPDECEVSHPVELISPEIGPIGNPLQPEHSFGVLPPSATEVILDFTASADLSAVDEFISVYLNGDLIGHVFFAEFAIDCADPPSIAQIVLTAEAFNALHADEDAETKFTFIATDAVNPFLCVGESYVTIALSYQSFAPNDLDLDSVPDECQAAGMPGDLDGDGDVDFNDLLQLLSAWGPCTAIPECFEDLDGSGDVAFGDLLILLSNWT